jgi:hypothetical protein
LQPVGSGFDPCHLHQLWKRGRVAYGVGLENRSVEMHREFESHRFRQEQKELTWIVKIRLIKHSQTLLKMLVTLICLIGSRLLVDSHTTT